jgi:3-methyladenine DNA glycosylase AlkC
MEQEIKERLLKTEHGFKPMEIEAKKLFDSNRKEENMKTAIGLLEDEHYQIRSVGVFLLGYLSPTNVSALQILRSKVSYDQSWQVQEILAKAFDQYCRDNGYEKSIPVISDWLGDQNPNVCRAVTEGLRIWTGRPYFNSNPEMAIRLISQHKAHDNEYLRKSVGNSLRDISKKHSELIKKELSTWDLSNKKILFTYKLVVKSK